MKNTAPSVHANRKHGTGNIPHPRKDFKNRIELYQFRRGPSNPTWDARYNIEGEWSGWSSLGTDSWDDAIFISVEKLNEREHAAKTGVQIVGRKRKEPNTVAEIAVGTLARLRAGQAQILATKESKKAHVFTARISAIESKLLPAFGDRGIASLTEDDMERFRLGVRTKGDKTPKRSTIANMNSAWLEVLRDAIDAGHISKARKKVLTISQEGFKKGERGASFTREEMEEIRAHMSDSWIAQGHTKVSRENRYLLRALVSLMATTGITPGLEVETLAPAQVVQRKDSNGHDGIRVSIREHQGKRANDRIVWARVNDVWPIVSDIRALRNWIKANATDDYHISNPAGYLLCRPSDGAFPIFHRVFEEVLETLKMRADPVTGVNRRLYSCRHYYATQALQDGVDVAFVAKNMGTSDRMIQDHYEHVLTDLRSGNLTGSKQMQGAWMKQTGVLARELERAENDPDYAIEDIIRESEAAPI